MYSDKCKVVFIITICFVLKRTVTMVAKSLYLYLETSHHLVTLHVFS
jgi:hypothetical protein